MKLPDKESTLKFIKSAIVLIGTAGYVISPEQQQYILTVAGGLYAIAQLIQGFQKKKVGN
jgi:hypothetical protein